MKSSIQIIRELRSGKLKIGQSHKSFVARSMFKDKIDFAGDNIILQGLYEKHMSLK